MRKPRKTIYVVLILLVVMGAVIIGWGIAFHKQEISPTATPTQPMVMKPVIITPARLDGG